MSSPEVVSGKQASLSHAPQIISTDESSDKQDDAYTSIFLMLGRSFRVPFLTLAPIDQGDKELCVAASFAQAIYGTAFSHEPLVRASVLRMPCCWIMY